MGEPLLDRTYRLLDASTLTYREIAAGADVGFEWLKKLASRKFADPGTSKIERLYNFLAAPSQQHAASDVRTPMQDA